MVLQEKKVISYKKLVKTRLSNEYGIELDRRAIHQTINYALKNIVNAVYHLWLIEIKNYMFIRPNQHRRQLKLNQLKR